MTFPLTPIIKDSAVDRWGVVGKNSTSFYSY